MLRIKSIGVTACALTFAIVFALSSTASAKDYTLSGEWFSQKGQFFRIPADAAPFSNRVFKGAAAAANAGVGPGAPVTVPASFWDDHKAVLTSVQNNTVIQLETDWDYTGPYLGAAVLKAQTTFTTGRPNATPNFRWCPGIGTGGAAGGAAANPNCLDNLAAGGIKRAGRVQYTAGANKFGGTMQYSLGGAGVISQVGANAGMASQVNTHNPLAGGTGALQVFGGPYENNDVVNLGSGPATTGALCNGSICGPPANGVITSPGVTVGTGAASLQTSFGFPFTTGTVRVSIPTSVNSVFPGPMTLVTNGSDSRNAAGNGNITLVAGGISMRLTGGVTPGYEHVKLNLGIGAPGGDVPAMSPAGLAAGAALFLLAFGYAIRRRL